MANEWSSIIRQVASRMNVVKGAQVADAEAAYIVTPFTAAQTNDAAYNYSLIKDACADTEAMVAQVVASTPNHPWRNALKVLLDGSGGGFSNGQNIYQRTGVGATTNVLGIGDVYILSAGRKKLTKKPIEDIQRRQRNAGGFFTLPVLFYSIVDGNIYHTSADPVLIEGFEYDRTLTYTNIAADTKPIFPLACIPIYIVGALSILLKEEEYAQQCQYYSGIFSTMLAQLAGGFSSVDPLPVPAPLKGVEAQ